MTNYSMKSEEDAQEWSYERIICHQAGNSEVFVLLLPKKKGESGDRNAPFFIMRRW